MGAGKASLAWQGLRTAFSKERAERGFDINLARKASKSGWAIGALVGFGLEPFYPPTARIGTIGWAVTAGVVAATSVWMYLLTRHPERVSRDTLLLTAYLGLGYVAVAQWLAGGLPAPYHELYPFMILTAAAVQTPARFIGFLGVLMALAIVPEIGGSSAAELGDLATELGLWAMAAVFILGVMWKLRQHRADLAENSARANELARVDALTGLGNRRAFEEALATEIARARRSEAPLSLLVCDLDSFKAINDEHGHLAGDDCLKQVATTLRSELRGADVCFRWGGDEFVVILAGTSELEAMEVATRLEGLVARSCTRPDGTTLGITSGRATLSEWMTAEQLVTTADQALLKRKYRRPSARQAS